MAKTNRDRVGEALEALKKGLAPFVEREMKVVYGQRWKDEALKSFSDSGGTSRKIDLMDPQVTLVVMWDRWNLVFKNILGHAERSLVGEIRDMRNRWAHMENFSTDDTYRALDSIGRLLAAVSSPQAEIIEKQKMELLRLRFEEQRRSEARKSAILAIGGQPAANLKPWREVVTPHPDVASGRYQQAEFAADLWQVYLGEGADEYKNPTEFFRRTFLTEGLRQLLANAVTRLAGQGGDPVVELQTNFGGGKTHSMLALYHLFSGVPPTDLPGIDDVLEQVGVKVPSGVKRCVIVGTRISPGQPVKKSDGTVVRTLWGEIAWQLGGRAGYNLVKEADETASNPGDALREILNRYSPCLILIDEWVAYARQLHDNTALPGGTFDTQFTFAHALTEIVKSAKSALLVASIPVSDIEIGGTWGQAALSRLKNVVGRVEASWRPASQDEGFEIVRRRLFQPITDPALFVERDQVARAFCDMYGTQRGEFPMGCREGDYERRLQAAYPIHPELFDRLYNDWSTLEKFQRTRGVLRLMAAVIHSLWERQDNNLLILPATVPIDDPQVQFELTRYLEDQWVPVIEKDVDGQRSLPLAIDRENPNLGRYSACRRVARTIYMGSAPTQRAANRGIEDRQVKLGCVQPGESAAVFGDALRRLTDKATYLYVDGQRYWYSTQPTVARLAEDRASQVHEADAMGEIEKRLRSQAKTRGDFAKVHACAPGADIPEEQEARLVILGPGSPHIGKDQGSPARAEAAAILESRGSSPRTCRNTLVFLAADSNRLKELDMAVRQYLAWRSIWDERESLNLDAFQSRQAETKYHGADDTVEARLPEAYIWLLVPGQQDPKGSIDWTEIRLQGQDSLAVRASKKLRTEEMLFTQLGGVRLRHELDRVPLWRGDNVSVKQLISDFATYLYLPRLKDENVLLAAIQDGVGRLTWKDEAFAYAEGWDEAGKRYLGLSAGKNVRILADGKDLLVKPEVAAKEMEAKAPAGTAAGPESGGVPGLEAGATDKGGAGQAGTVAPPVRVIRRFHGSVKLDSVRVGRDAARIAEEVVQHLTGQVGADVDVTLEIQARLPEGVPEKMVRDVTENCRTLKFENYGFEEE